MHRKQRNRPETAPAFTFRSQGLSQSIPTPENALAALLAIRAEAEALTEKLVEFLDMLDGDPDREDGGDAEPDIKADNEPLFADLRGGTRIGAKQ